MLSNKDQRRHLADNSNNNYTSSSGNMLQQSDILSIASMVLYETNTIKQTFDCAALMSASDAFTKSLIVIVMFAVL